VGTPPERIVFQERQIKQQSLRPLRIDVRFIALMVDLVQECVIFSLQDPAKIRGQLRYCFLSRGLVILIFFSELKSIVQ
jgi:hypothetical protein